MAGGNKDRRSRYEKLIQRSLGDLRKQVPGIGYLTGDMHILEPLYPDEKVEVLFLVNKDAPEPMTAWFENVDAPEPPRIDAGW